MAGPQPRGRWTPLDFARTAHRGSTALPSREEIPSCIPTALPRGRSMAAAFSCSSVTTTRIWNSGIPNSAWRRQGPTSPWPARCRAARMLEKTAIRARATRRSVTWKRATFRASCSPAAGCPTSSVATRRCSTSCGSVPPTASSWRRSATAAGLPFRRGSIAACG